MARQVNCVKLEREADGLDMTPFPGELGKKIFDNVSKTAWDEWIKLQTILINEHRLRVFEPKARDFLQQEMQKFLFAKDPLL